MRKIPLLINGINCRDFIGHTYKLNLRQKKELIQELDNVASFRSDWVSFRVFIEVTEEEITKELILKLLEKIYQKNGGEITISSIMEAE